MDPDVTLSTIRDQVALWAEGCNYDADILAEHVSALDGWLSKGGFLPDPWHA